MRPLVVGWLKDLPNSLYNWCSIGGWGYKLWDDGGRPCNSRIGCRIRGRHGTVSDLFHLQAFHPGIILSEEISDGFTM